MGLDCEARTVVGLPYDEVVKKITERQTVTRYDEKTGEPYEKEITKTRWTLFGNHSEGDPEEWDWFYENREEIAPLQAFTADCDKPKVAVGVTVGRTISHRDTRDNLFDECSLDRIETSTEAALQTFKRMGMEITRDDLRLFTIQYMSY